MTYRILIVDDSRLARMAVTKALNALRPDWARVEAANADEAVAQMNEQAVDIALLDFNMPGRDGLTLAGELRAAQPAMPIAVISANYQTEVVSRAHGIGAAFLTKPLTEAALREFVDEAQRRLDAQPK